MKPSDLHADNRQLTLPTDVRLTAPFGLLERLKPPSKTLDFVPILDLVVIALIFSLLFTRFVMLPGVSVVLPSTELKVRHSSSSVAVLTVGNRGMLLFNGSVYDNASIEPAFRRYITEVSAPEPILLVKADASMELQRFLDLCRLAQDAGFVNVQISGKRKESQPAFLSADGALPTSDFLRPGF